jgi:hypothetical protein
MDSNRFRRSFDEAADLAEARARSDAMTLDERFEEAVAFYVLAIVELARLSATPEELLARLDREPPGCPTDRWRELEARRGKGR